MGDRLRSGIYAAAAALAALVLAHNFIFLAHYWSGFGRALTSTGHGQAWVTAAIVSLALGAALVVGAAWRRRALQGQAGNLGLSRLPSEPDRRAMAQRWLIWWAALLVVTVVLFVLEENVELASLGQRLPGIGVLLSDQYPNAVVIISLVALAVSLVAALFGWKIEALIARIHAQRAIHATPAGSMSGSSDPVERRPNSILGRRLAGRAPPVLA